MTWRDWAFEHARHLVEADWMYRKVRACRTTSDGAAFLAVQLNMSGSLAPGRPMCEGTATGVEVFAHERDDRRCRHAYHPGGFMGVLTYREIAQAWRADGMPVQMTLFDEVME